MGKRIGPALLVLLAAGAVVYLVAGTDLLGGDPDGGTGTPGAGGVDALATGPAGTGTRDATAGGRPAEGPVLFGRPWAQRRGIGALAGRVREFASGEAVASATVVVAGTAYDATSIALQVRTDEDGRFRLAEVPAGAGYTLYVAAPGGAERSLPAVTVDAGGLTDVGTVWLGRRGVLAGKVVGEAGEGVPGAIVQVHASSGSLLQVVQDFTSLFERIDEDAEPVARAETAREGRFEIPDLDPGPLLLVVRAPGFAQAYERVVMTAEGAVGGEVVVRLTAAEPFGGLVVDERDRPVAGARVAAFQQSDLESVFYGRQYAVTDAQGRFRIDAPPAAGKYSVLVTAAGRPMLFAKAQPGTDNRFVLAGGAEIALRFVYEDDGAPLGGVFVMAAIAEAGEQAPQMGSMATGVGDARGEVVLNACPGVLQMVWFSVPGRGASIWSPQLAGMGVAGQVKGPQDATVREGRNTFTFRVARGITLRGRVIDEDDAPIAGARVMVVGVLGAGAAAVTDAAGAFELRGQSPDTTTLMATAPGYAPGTGRGGGEPDAAGVVEVDVALERATSITGRVLGPDGTPLPGVRVRLGGSEPATMWLGARGGTITNAAGRYVIDGAGSQEDGRVVGRRAGYLDSATPEFPVPKGATVAAPDLVMRLGSQVVAIVEEPGGRPRAGARVEARSDAKDRVVFDPMDEWRGLADATTDREGRAVLRDLPDGQLTLTASRDGFAAARRKIDVAREVHVGRQEVRLSLRQAVVLEGRVRDPAGRPVAGATVTTQEDGEGEAWMPARFTTADAEGRFRLDNLPGLAATIEVEAAGHRRTTVEVQSGLGAIDVTLEHRSAEAAARIAAIDEELARLMQAWQAAADEAEREALMARVQALMQEKGDLQGGEDGGRAAPVRR